MCPDLLVMLYPTIHRETRTPQLLVFHVCVLETCLRVRDLGGGIHSVGYSVISLYVQSNGGSKAAQLFNICCTLRHDGCTLTHD